MGKHKSKQKSKPKKKGRIFIGKKSILRQRWGKKGEIEAVFDENLRKDFLKSFKGRKLLRRKHGLTLEAMKTRKKKIEKRKERKEHLNEVLFHTFHDHPDDPDGQKVDETSQASVLDKLEDDVDQVLRARLVGGDSLALSTLNGNKRNGKKSTNNDNDTSQEQVFDDQDTQSMFGNVVSVTTTVGIPLDEDEEQEIEDEKQRRKRRTFDRKQKEAGSFEVLQNKMMNRINKQGGLGAKKKRNRRGQMTTKALVEKAIGAKLPASKRKKRKKK